MFMGDGDTEKEQDFFIMEEVKAMSEGQLLSWLAYPENSLRPKLYTPYLPEGLEYISGPTAVNCFDFAQGCRGLGYLDKDYLTRAKRQENNIVVYYLEGRPNHAGIMIENGERVISQWGVRGPIMKHKQMQVPKNYGTNCTFWKLKKS